MKPITKILRNLTPEEYYEKHLYIIHHFFEHQLAPKEIYVLALFMAIKGDLAEQDRFGTQCRKIVMEKAKIQAGGLGNYMKQFLEKGYITKDENNKYHLNPWLIPDPTAQVYQFRIDIKPEV